MQGNTDINQCPELRWFMESLGLGGKMKRAHALLLWSTDCRESDKLIEQNSRNQQFMTASCISNHASIAIGWGEGGDGYSQIIFEF